MRPPVSPPSGVPLVWPTALSLSITVTAPTVWIQVAKIGEFVSSRYGRFEITKDDLQTMLSNFKTITPIAPTQLPIDYDHLSMDPKRPGDGKAAGWFTGPMELRDGGGTLWAEVEFTPAAASHIRNKEYRFISPSFVKNYVWKDGKNIGTTLIAAAVTNMPFLEGMEAITLTNDLGELAIQLAENGGRVMEVGQVVAIKIDVDPTRAGQAFEILEVAGTGGDAFAKLKDRTGVAIGWFRATELAPARAKLHAATQLLNMAKDRMREHAGLSLRDALHRVAEDDPATVRGYRDQTSAPHLIRASASPLAMTPSSQIAAIAQQRATETGLSFVEAARQILSERPDLAEHYMAGVHRRFSPMASRG